MMPNVWDEKLYHTAGLTVPTKLIVDPDTFETSREKNIFRVELLISAHPPWKRIQKYDFKQWQMSFPRWKTLGVLL
jgi:hypothetical protein